MTKKRRIEPKPTRVGCRWFAGCPRTATGTTPHRALGEVPTCDQCHHFATGEHRRHATQTA